MRNKQANSHVDYFYVTVDGERWCPECRLNEASRYYERACRIYELDHEKPHTIRLMHVVKETLVGW